MLSTSKKCPIFQVITTGADGSSLTGTRAIIKVSGHQHQWLAGGLEIRHF